MPDSGKGGKTGGAVFAANGRAPQRFELNRVTTQQTSAASRLRSTRPLFFATSSNYFRTFNYSAAVKCGNSSMGQWSRTSDYGQCQNPSPVSVYLEGHLFQIRT